MGIDNWPLVIEIHTNQSSFRTYLLIAFTYAAIIRYFLKLKVIKPPGFMCTICTQYLLKKFSISSSPLLEGYFIKQNQRWIHRTLERTSSNTPECKIVFVTKVIEESNPTYSWIASSVQDAEIIKQLSRDIRSMNPHRHQYQHPLRSILQFPHWYDFQPNLMVNVVSIEHPTLSELLAHNVDYPKIRHLLKFMRKILRQKVNPVMILLCYKVSWKFQHSKWSNSNFNE